jgi:hypothetical protein
MLCDTLPLLRELRDVMSQMESGERVKDYFTISSLNRNSNSRGIYFTGSASHICNARSGNAVPLYVM